MRKTITILIVTLITALVALSDSSSVTSSEPLLPQPSEFQSELSEQMPDAFFYVRTTRQNSSNPTSRRLQSYNKARKAYMATAILHCNQSESILSTFYNTSTTSVLRQSLTIVLRNIRI